MRDKGLLAALIFAMTLASAMAVGCGEIPGEKGGTARCDCEWCAPGPGHGCHAIDLGGPCGGQAGQRAPYDACHGVESRVVGIVVAVALLALAVGTVVCWCGWACVRCRHCPPDPLERRSVAPSIIHGVPIV